MPSKTIHSIQALLKDIYFHTFLIDASGVIYNEDGVIDTAPDCISFLQSIGNVFLVTNNSYMNPGIIEGHLNSKGIDLPKSNIISSGHGLKEDHSINQIIKNKKVYIFGRETSYEYVENADCKIIFNINNAEAIILTTSLREDTNEEYQKIKSFCLDNPKIPVICCNPDLYVKGIGNSLIKVIGYYGRQLEIDLNRQLAWIGKPYKNFSNIVKDRLEEKNIAVDKHILFFDDNYLNVIALQRDIGISGCLVKDTGLSLHLDSEQRSDVHNNIAYQINQLTR